MRKSNSNWKITTSVLVALSLTLCQFAPSGFAQVATDNRQTAAAVAENSNPLTANATPAAPAPQASARSKAKWIAILGGAGGAAAAALLLTRDKSDGSADRPTGGNLSPVSYDGFWVGTTSQNKPLRFTISGGAVTTIMIEYTLTNSVFGCSQTLPVGSTITLFGGNTLSGHSFSISGSLTLRGTFSSGTAATGTFTENFPGQPGGCPASASGTWTATKQ